MLLAKNLSFLFTILISISLFAKTVFLTDLEGQIKPVHDLIKNGTFKLDSLGNLDFVDSNTKLVFIFGADFRQFEHFWQDAGR